MHQWHARSGRAYITAGVGYGKTELAAFDAAELDAGIMATNAIRVTSFVPPNWKIIKDKAALKRRSGKGAFLPMAYACATSKTTKVSASLAIGVNRNTKEASIIAEHAEEGVGRQECIATSLECIKETFRFRKWEAKEIIRYGVEAAPKRNLYACALVAVLFFPDYTSF